VDSRSIAKVFEQRGIKGGDGRSSRRPIRCTPVSTQTEMDAKKGWCVLARHDPRLLQVLQGVQILSEIREGAHGAG
jgi:hypothetical protein